MKPCKIAHCMLNLIFQFQKTIKKKFHLQNSNYKLERESKIRYLKQDSQLWLALIVKINDFDCEFHGIGGEANLFKEIIGDPIVVTERNPIVDLDFASYGVDVDLHPFFSAGECQNSAAPVRFPGDPLFLPICICMCFPLSISDRETCERSKTRRFGRQRKGRIERKLYLCRHGGVILQNGFCTMRWRPQNFQWVAGSFCTKETTSFCYLNCLRRFCL